MDVIKLTGSRVVASRCSAFGECTIRTSDCAVLVVSGGGRCSSCVRFRPTLRAMLHRQEQLDHDCSDPTSTSNIRYLHTPERMERFRRLRGSYKQRKEEVERLKVKLTQCIEHRSVSVDEELHDELVTAMRQNNNQIIEQYQPGSFQRVFWEQQEQASKLKSAHSMRWDPLMICSVAFVWTCLRASP